MISTVYFRPPENKRPTQKKTLRVMPAEHIVVRCFSCHLFGPPVAGWLTRLRLFQVGCEYHVNIPLKINKEPPNQPIEKEHHYVPISILLVRCWVFQAVSNFFPWVSSNSEARGGFYFLLKHQQYQQGTSTKVVCTVHPRCCRLQVVNR